MKMVTTYFAAFGIMYMHVYDAIYFFSNCMMPNEKMYFIKTKYTDISIFCLTRLLYVW